MPAGYAGKILRVDLSREQTKEEPLPPAEVLKKYIGCWALGMKILYDECPVGISPLDARNPLIFMNGPLTGSGVPMSNNSTVVTLNYETGYTAGRAHSHGFWGPNLKWAGYDGLIIQGAAKRPVYLWIHDGQVEFRDAAKMWGRDSHDTEDLVKEDLGEARASVGAIGPTGENLCSGAMIENDKNHTWAHGGCGSVMGSKKLKAIAVRGTQRIPPAKEGKFRKARDAWIDKVKLGNAMLYFQQGGVPRADYTALAMMDVFLIAKNWTTTQLAGFGEGMSNQKITGRPCFACPVACSYDVEVVDGPYKGYVATLAGGGENLEGAAAAVGISETGAVFYLTDLIDRLGFEAGTLGGAMGVAFEAYEKELLTKERTGGLELRWGNVEVVEKLIKMAAARDGFGNIIADGPLRTAEWIGGPALDWVVHIKGAGFNFHDWKSGPWGTWFGQLIGGGTGWQTWGADLLAEPDCGFEVETPKRTHVGKAREVAVTTPKKYWIDSVGCCWFAFLDGGSLDLSVDAVNGVTGWNLSRQDAFDAGWRSLHLERAFNMLRGLRPEDDYVVSQRVLEANRDGPAAGMTFAPYVKGMVMDYYRECGWDEKTGRPWRHTLENLGMDAVIKDLWG
jgi:aldehyde:ferredoxin oxidoreductase